MFFSCIFTQKPAEVTVSWKLFLQRHRGSPGELSDPGNSMCVHSEADFSYNSLRQRIHLLKPPRTLFHPRFSWSPSVPIASNDFSRRRRKAHVTFVRLFVLITNPSLYLVLCPYRIYVICFPRLFILWHLNSTITGLKQDENWVRT